MNQRQQIAFFKDLQHKVNAACIQHARSVKPVSISELKGEMRPFLEVEKAISRELNRLQMFETVNQ